jgi:hypothetical protein
MEIRITIEDLSTQEHISIEQVVDNFAETQTEIDVKPIINLLKEKVVILRDKKVDLDKAKKKYLYDYEDMKKLMGF